jgi:Protein of unknown function (DUF2933)
LTYRIKGFLQMTALAVAAAALFWLLREHWQHVFGYLPYLLFLACPLMHLFMHHGHGHGHDHHEHTQNGQSQPPAR